jgi:Calcineurin-like phosphoesterase
MATSTFTWLHLTDLHIGQPTYGADIRNVGSWILEDVQELQAHVLKTEGIDLRPDVVFFTGDLAYSGSEYGTPGIVEPPSSPITVESFLADLWRRFPRSWKPAPLLAPVPGNHDVAWEEFTEDELVLWRHFHDESALRKQFFRSAASARQRRPALDGKGPASADYWLHKKVLDASSRYQQWLETSHVPRVDTQRFPGLLPGEYAATHVSPDNVQIGILALNSTYYDIPRRERSKEGKLGLYPDQLTGFGELFEDWCARHQACIIITHHPPKWINQAALSKLKGAYFSGSKIALHLCGHLHEASDTRYGAGWDGQTLIYQGRSLFGMEPLPDAPGEESESFGYALGQIRVETGSATATLRMHSRRARRGGAVIWESDGNATGFTSLLPEQRIKVRPLKTRSDLPPEPLAPPNLTLVTEEIARSISDRNGNKRAFVVSGPPRYGKTSVAIRLEELLGSMGVVVVRIDLAEMLSNQEKDEDGEGVLLSICRELHSKVHSSAYTPPPEGVSITRCIERCLSAKPALYVLLLDAFTLLGGEANFLIQAKLRHCLENRVYTRSAPGGFRLVLFTSLPGAEAVPWAPDDNPYAASPLFPLCHEEKLDRVSEADLVKWASQFPHWKQRPNLLQWLWSHTGGHPALIFDLLAELNELAQDQWPAWTDESASPDLRASELHAATGPLATRVANLKTNIRIIAADLRRRKIENPARDARGGLCTPQRDALIPFAQKALLT